MIRTIDNLIEWLQDNVGNPIHRWSLIHDKIEILGFFNKIKWAGFIVKLTSRHGNAHYLKIAAYNFGRTY